MKIVIFSVILYVYIHVHVYICAMYVFTCELQLADFVLQTADLWGVHPSDLR